MTSVLPEFEGLSRDAELLRNQVLYDANLIYHLGEIGLTRDSLTSIATWLNESVGDSAPGKLTEEQMKNPDTLHFIEEMLIDFEDKSNIAAFNGATLAPEGYVLALCMHNPSIHNEVLGQVNKYFAATAVQAELARTEFDDELLGGSVNG